MSKNSKQNTISKMDKIFKDQLGLAKLIHNLSKQFDPEATIEAAVVKAKDIHIEILIEVHTRTPDLIVCMSRHNHKLLTMRYHNNDYTVLNCVRLVLFHELNYKHLTSNSHA